MKIKEWLNQAKQQIQSLDAESLLLDTLGADDKTYLVLHEEDELDELLLVRANKMMERRQTGEPLAYILGYKEFYGRKFKVDSSTLIPRPETEQIIDEVKKMADGTQGLKIWDIGTGSGCIAITLSLEIPSAQVSASDISAQALSVAEDNAGRLGAKVDFTISDLAEKISEKNKPDIVVANLPYVDANWEWLDKKSLSYEPELALYAENEGLELIYRLIGELTKCHDIKILLEADLSQHQKIIDYAKLRGYKNSRVSGYIVILS